MRKRSKALLAVLVAAGALAVLVVAAEASGSSPQQVLSGAFGSGPGSYVPPPQGACCGYRYPCVAGTTYWRWCGCYPPLAQGGSSGPQVAPCYPPPCTGVCPMNTPQTPAG